MPTMRGLEPEISQDSTPRFAVVSGESRFETCDFHAAAAHGLEWLAHGQQIVLWLEDEIALELHDLVVRPLPLSRRCVAFHALDQHPPIPTSVEQGEATKAGDVLPEPPQEMSGLLVERGLGKGGHGVMTRVERLDDALDRPTLSARIGTFHHHDHARPERSAVEEAGHFQPESQALVLCFDQPGLVLLPAHRCSEIEIVEAAQSLGR